MSGREEVSGHFAGCANRKVETTFWNGRGTVVILECGHSHFTGKRPFNPTVRPCLEGPCYHPVREFAS